MRLFTFFTPSPARSVFGRWSRVALALAGATLVAGCDLNFWRMDGPQSTIDVAGPVALNQLEIFYVTCWVTFVIFLLVAGVLAYATLKFRARNAADEHAEPPAQSHGNPLIELGLIGASVLALVIIAIPTLQGIWYTHDVPEAEKEKYLKRVPLQRPGTPQDVAELVHFLATGGTYITGQIIRLDGGRSIT